MDIQRNQQQLRGERERQRPFFDAFSKQGYDFSQSVGKIENVKFDFGKSSASVDQTLATLFDTLTVECSGILVQPQWKHFRHIRMLKNDRYRLSNGIWRSWHMQFQKSKRPLYCVFDIDASLTHHKRQAAVVLEGKYWKRKLSAVATEYRKWRVHYKEKNKTRKLDPALRPVQERGNVIFENICRNFKPQMMQIDSVRPPFLHNLDAFSENIFPNFTKDSPDAIATMDFMIQQPNLEVLNPTTLDDFLDKMEPMEVMLSQVINSTLDIGQSSLPTSFSGGGAGGEPMSSTQPYATPTPTQPPISDGQFTSSSGYANGSYMAEFTQSATQGQDLSQQQQRSFPLSPTSFLNAQGKGNKPTGGGNLARLQDESNYSMKNESLEGVTAYPGQQSMVFDSYGQQQQQQLPPPPPHQGYGAMNRTSMTSPDTNYNMAIKDEASIGTMGQFLNQFLSDPLNPSQVPTDTSQCYQQPSASQQPLPSSNMFQFPTTPLSQQSQAFASSSLSSLLQQPSTGMGDSAGQGSIVRVSSAGNLGLLTDESTSSSQSLAPIRPPLSRGRSEPIRHLQQQVKHLAEENQRQMMEIEKQQSIAEQQYVSVLQQLAEQQATGKASREQQEVLKSVLSDPNLVTILRDILLANPPPSALQDGSGSTSQQQQHRERLPPLNVTPSKMSTDSGGTHVSSTPSPLISPSQGHLYGFSVGVSGSASSMPVTPSADMGPSKGGSIQLGDLDNFLTMQAQKKFKSSRHMSTEEKEVFKEIRRQSHISAEQKRRGSIKHGFSQLQSMVINLASYPSGKVSKATILEKTIEHIQHSHIEREEREKKIETYKRQIEELNASIAQCQEQLPASGVPITRQRFEENRQRFRDYIQRRTLQNYKFWVFSLILQQLFESYNSMVSTGSVEELCRTVLAWFEQYCTLPALRPVVMDSLRELSQKTSILTDPGQVPHQLSQFAQQSLHQSQQAQQAIRRLKQPSRTAPAGIFN